MAARFVIAPTEAYGSYSSADDYAVRGHPHARFEARRLIEHVLAPGASVLDLSCGASFLLEEAAKISPARRHYGVDASSNMARIAMQHLHSACGDTVPKVRADVRKPQQLRAVLRGPDAPHAPLRFDVVVCINVLAHIDPRTHGRLLVEWGEHVAPGGSLVVSRACYSDVSRTTLSSSVAAGLRAPVPGLCLGFSVPTSSDGGAGAPATAPRDPVLAVRLAGDAVQRASDAQLARVLDKAARS